MPENFTPTVTISLEEYRTLRSYYYTDTKVKAINEFIDEAIRINSGSFISSHSIEQHLDNARKLKADLEDWIC